MSEIARQVLPADAVLGAEAGLAEQLEHAPSWTERFALVGALLARRLSAAAAPRPDRDVRDFAGGPPTDVLARRLSGDAGISAA